MKKKKKANYTLTSVPYFIDAKMWGNKSVSELGEFSIFQTILCQ